MLSSAEVAEGRKKVQRAALISVLSAAALTAMKFIIGFSTNSLGIISEALHSGLDFAAAGITLVAVRRASKGPDSQHQFGHGKIENFAALSETIILWVTSVWIIFEAWRRIELQEWPESSIWGILVMAIGVVVTFWQSRLLYRTAEEHGSQALEADALHFRTDMISSAVVLLGLGFVWIDIPIADPIAAIGVAIIIFVVSYRLGRRTFDALTDAAPEGLKDEIIRRVEGINGVVECRRTRVRHSGPELFVDIVLSVDETVRLSEAHGVTDLIERALLDLAPRVDVVIHVEPAEGDDSEFLKLDIYNQMQVIARRLSQVHSVHNLRVFSTPEGIDIAADIELSENLTLDEAHSISEKFEESLKNMVPHVNTVTLHLETTIKESPAQDITHESSEIIELITKIMADTSKSTVCSNIVVQKEENEVAVLITCTISGEITLTESHEIAESLKKRIIETLPEISSVFIHFEPC
ncbi:MAG: cation diffusion facilitator family transporter [Candidatus Thorarchaeota archaeon]